jgi:hypothetical protein
LGDGTPDPRCPECGAPFTPADPWTPPSWPTTSVLATRLCGPLALVICGLVAFGLHRITRMFVWPLAITWALAIVFFALFWPLVAAKALARERLPVVEQRRAVRHLAVAAIAFNLGAAALGIFTFFALL